MTTAINYAKLKQSSGVFLNTQFVLMEYLRLCVRGIHVTMPCAPPITQLFAGLTTVESVLRNGLWVIPSYTAMVCGNHSFCIQICSIMHVHYNIYTAKLPYKRC